MDASVALLLDAFWWIWIDQWGDDCMKVHMVSMNE
jgi:hypothetical protein